MSRTRKDRPFRLGGQKHKYWTSEGTHAWFTRDCRRRARAQAKKDLRLGLEPQPTYPVERVYYD